MKNQIVGAAILACVAAGPAAAQNVSARTFVSAKGTDSGICAPATSACRSFAYAVTQTPAGGALVALDPAGYGPVTITQAMSITGPGKGLASISAAAGGTGITINAGAGDAVVLRGIEVDGGNFGIGVNTAGSVVIADSVFRNAAGSGIANFGSKVVVQDSTLVNSALFSQGTSLLAKRVNILGSLFYMEGGVSTLDGCALSGSSLYGVQNAGGRLFVKNTLISGYGSGISTSQSFGDSTTYIATTTTVNNGTGVDAGSVTYSFGNNNFTEGTSGAITPVAQN